MNRIILRNIDFEETHIDKLHVLLDDEGAVIVLPLLWTIHLANLSSVYGWRTRGTFFSNGSGGNTRKPKSIDKSFVLKPISENTVENYIGHFFQFLKYINELHKAEGTPSVHNSEHVNSKFINNYLNSVLSNRLSSSSSLAAHQAAISAYFSFLFELEIKDALASNVNRTTRKFMAENDFRQKKINYVSHSERSSLLLACSNNRDRLILRMGFEVGLRAEENTGMVLGEHKAKSQTHKGLLCLFDELSQFPSKQSFEFVLNGKYTKGGKTRNIYIDRELLSSMKHYYDNERLEIMQKSGRFSDTLFVRTDKGGAGLSICPSHASNVFREVKEFYSHINSSLAYHDLRHTFATELYHSELISPEGRETRSESAALTVVSERLGHSNVSSTKRYIRIRQQMILIEKSQNE